MNSNKIFQKFCRDRNIKSSTRKGYNSALKVYKDFNGKTIKELFAEARFEENERIPLKNRKIKNRLTTLELICSIVNYLLILQRHIFQK